MRSLAKNVVVTSARCGAAPARPGRRRPGPPCTPGTFRSHCHSPAPELRRMETAPVDRLAILPRPSAENGARFSSSHGCDRSFPVRRLGFRHTPPRAAEPAAVEPGRDGTRAIGVSSLSDLKTNRRNRTRYRGSDPGSPGEFAAVRPVEALIERCPVDHASTLCFGDRNLTISRPVSKAYFPGAVRGGIFPTAPWPGRRAVTTRSRPAASRRTATSIRPAAAASPPTASA